METTLPPHNVPFNNIRYLLSLHAKTGGERTFLITYDGKGKREELSYAEFNARAHQTANLLFDDLGVRRGGRVAILADNTTDTLLIYVACWILGVTVVPLNAFDDDNTLAHIFAESQSVLCVTDESNLPRTQRLVANVPTVRGILQLDGESRDDTVHFKSLVQNLPTTFLGDDAPIKSDDDRITANPSGVVATLDDVALLTFSDAKPIAFTQYALLASAQSIAQAQGFTGGQRALCILPLDHPTNLMFSIMTPLLVAGITVLNQSFSADEFWEKVVDERAHIVYIEPSQLEALIDHATHNEHHGNGLFGEKVIRQRLTHFRHFICTSKNLTVDLIRQFEDRFGIPILTGYTSDGIRCATLLPINLSWEAHQHWLLDHDTPSRGYPIDTNEVTILAPDGHELNAGEIGDIYLHQNDEWQPTGDRGYYQIDTDGRRFFFISEYLD